MMNRPWEKALGAVAMILTLGCGGADSTVNADDVADPGDVSVNSAEDGVASLDASSADAASPVDTASVVDVVTPPDLVEPPPVDTAQPLDTATDPAPTQSLPSGVNELFFTQAIEGVPTERLVLLHAPKTIDPVVDYPVVFFFHGAGGQAGSWTNKAGKFIDQEHYVGVYPSGHLKQWNTGYQETKADDVAFVGMIVEALKDYKQLNLTRMFVVGSSNGAALAHELAIHTDYFVGFTAIVTALTVDSKPTPNTPVVGVLQILGMKDNLCKYDGGKAPMGMTFLPAEESAAVWAAHNGCGDTPTTTTTAEGNKRIEYSGCTDGVRVVHYGITEAGHGMPPTTEGGTFPLFWDFFESLP